MSHLKIVVLIIFTVSILVGCSIKQEEISEIENRLKILESISESNSEILKKLEDTNHNIEILKENIYLIDEKLEMVQNSVRFLEEMSFGSANFDRNKIKVGDYAAGMALVEITNLKGIQFLFSGKKNLTGRFEIINDDEYWGNIVTFHIDDKVTDILPREITDYRSLWFRFSNYDKAVELLSPYGMSGTVQ